MSADAQDREQLAQELADLRRTHDELERSLPRHSIKPSQLMRLEELEEAIERIEATLARMDSG